MCVKDVETLQACTVYGQTAPPSGLQYNTQVFAKRIKEIH